MFVNGASRGRVGVGALHGGGGLEGQNGGPETSSFQLDHETDRDRCRERQNTDRRAGNVARYSFKGWRILLPTTRACLAEHTRCQLPSMAFGAGERAASIYLILCSQTARTKAWT